MTSQNIFLIALVSFSMLTPLNAASQESLKKLERLVPKSAETKSEVLDLSNADMRSYNLCAPHKHKKIDLTKANLKGANFSGMKISHVNFEGANIEGANFTNAQSPVVTFVIHKRPKRFLPVQLCVGVALTVQSLKTHFLIKQHWNPLALTLHKCKR